MGRGDAGAMLSLRWILAGLAVAAAAWAIYASGGGSGPATPPIATERPAAGSPTPLPAARPPNFEVLEWSIVPGSDGGKPRVVGEVRNNGGVPMGVELRVVVRDAQGRIVRVDDFWPASARNVAPGETYAFSTFLESSPGDAAEIRIIRETTW
jgi:hypothetical protein